MHIVIKNQPPMIALLCLSPEKGSLYNNIMFRIARMQLLTGPLQLHDHYVVPFVRCLIELLLATYVTALMK
jgi:hypothetical protein